MADNAFIRIDDFARAQNISDEFRSDDLHHVMDQYVESCCPITDAFLDKYHWSFMQIEYSTDLVFRDEAKLKPLITTARHWATGIQYPWFSAC
jgi:hypothetical protein